MAASGDGHGRAGGEFCYFVIQAVAWPVADQSASGQLGTLIQQFVYRPDRRQDSVVFIA
jgi:hypothetical protein